MSLSEEINKQYSKRNSKAHLYANSPYVRAVQEELKENCNLILKNYFNDYSNLKVLEIGAGNGTNAFMFESIGFQLNNISFNELLEDRIKAIENNFPNNKLYKGDAITIEIPEKFDIVFQSTVFTSILSNESRVNLANKMWSLLKPGGVILWYDFVYNNPKNKDVRKVDVREVKQLFKMAGKQSIVKLTLAPPIGRRVGKLYALFNIPILRSHILAVFQKNGNQ